MMKMNDTKFRILTVIVFILMYSLASAADNVVVLPIGGSVGNATAADVLKDKTFSSRTAGRGVSGTLELSQQYAIGDTGPAGGIVFWVSSNGQQGLEAAPSDQSDGIRWYNGSSTNTEAHGDGLGAGEMNTMLIIANQGSDSNSYAAGLCANLVITNGDIDYGDWYLPSKDELNLMYDNLHVIGMGSFANELYWCSTEGSTNSVWVKAFNNGVQGILNKNTVIRVRAIRAF